MVVVGAGLMGSAAASALARRGLSVTLVEQFEPGHRQGSSHGSARIVRRAYGDVFYTRLAGRAFELWQALEESAEVTLLRMLGGLDFGPPDAVAPVAAGLAAADVTFELLGPRDAEARWPGLRLDGDVLFHPQAGTVDAAGAVDAFVRLASRAGAEVRWSTEVSSLSPRGDGALLRFASGQSLTARHVVVAAGAWVAALLPGLPALPPLTVTQQQTFHFARADPAQPPWPSVIHRDFGRAGGGVYHLAGGRDGGPADDRKIGEHEGGHTASARERDGIVDAASRARVVEYVRRWLPGLSSTPSAETTCLYTSTPSEDFVLDRVGPVVVCSPCSGHGAKFAPLIGELAADLVTGRDGVPERFGLRAHARAGAARTSL